jgi:hypothetical protein
MHSTNQSQNEKFQELVLDNFFGGRISEKQILEPSNLDYLMPRIVV